MGFALNFNSLKEICIFLHFHIIESRDRIKTCLRYDSIFQNIENESKIWQKIKNILVQKLMDESTIMDP